MANVLEVTKGTFEEEVLKSDKLTIVKFGATWCGPCKKLDPIIDSIAQENEDVKITYVNIDNETGLAAEYGVLSVPTTLFISGGEVKDTIVGLVPKAKIEKTIAAIKG